MQNNFNPRYLSDFELKRIKNAGDTKPNELEAIIKEQKRRDKQFRSFKLNMGMRYGER